VTRDLISLPTSPCVPPSFTTPKSCLLSSSPVYKDSDPRTLDSPRVEVPPSSRPLSLNYYRATLLRPCFLQLYLVVYFTLLLLMSPCVGKKAYFGPRQYPPRPIPTDLGVPQLEGATEFVRRFFAREFVLAYQFKPEHHVIRRFDHVKLKDVYTLNDVFVRQGYEALLRTGRSAVALVADAYPFAEVGGRYTFSVPIPQDRVLDIGGFPSLLPDLNRENDNPLAGSFDTELDLLRTAHQVQKYIKKFVKFIERAYNKKGQSTDANDPWDFNDVLAVATDDGLNACFPGAASLYRADAWQALQDAVALIQTNVVPAVDKNEAPEVIDVDAAPSPPSMPVPHPTPVLSIPGLTIIEDIDKMQQQLDNLETSPVNPSSRLVSVVDPPAVHANPLHLDNHPGPVITATSNMARVAPLDDDYQVPTYHPGCACGFHNVAQEIYEHGRDDEHQHILRQNIEYGFIAHRLDDFFDFAAYAADVLEIRTNVEPGSPVPPLASPILSNDSN
jgi:hypothetical protein